MVVEIILFAFYLASALVVNREIDENHLEGDLRTLPYRDREILHVMPWIPLLNTGMAICLVWADIKLYTHRLKLKIWVWYVRQITNRYWKIQSDLIKKHGSKWYLDGIDDEIKIKFPK